MKINIMTLMLMWMTATSTLSAQTDRTLTADEVAGLGKDIGRVFRRTITYTLFSPKSSS